jgi:hypothetical protein
LGACCRWRGGGAAGGVAFCGGARPLRRRSSTELGGGALVFLALGVPRTLRVLQILAGSAVAADPGNNVEAEVGGKLLDVGGGPGC